MTNNPSFTIHTEQTGAESVARDFGLLRDQLKQIAEQGKRAALGMDAIGDSDGEVRKLTQSMIEGRAAVHATAIEAGKLRRELEDTSTLSLLAGIEDGAEKSIVDVERLNKTVSDLREEVNKVPDTPLNVGGRGTAGGGRDVSGLNDRTFSQLAGAANQLGLPGGGALQLGAGIADVTENLPKLGAEIAGLGAAGIASTAAVGGVALALYGLKKALDADAAAAQENIDAIEKRFATEKELNALNLDSAQQKKDEFETEVANRRSALAQLDNLRDASREGDNVGKAFLASIEEVGDAVGVNVGALGAYNSAIEENYQKLDVAKESLTALTERLAILDAQAQGAFEGNATIAAIKRQIDLEKQAALAIETYSSASVEARINALKIEVESQQTLHDQLKAQADAALEELENAVDSGASSEKIAQLQATWTGLQEAVNATSEPLQDAIDQLNLFQNEVKPEVAAREQETEAIKRQGDAMKTLTSERDNLSKQLESVNDQIAQLADQEAQKRLEAQRKEVLKESQDQREAGLLSQLEAAKQVEAQQKAAKELTAARQAGLEKEQSATFKFHESEAKAEQKFSADLAKLEGERNKIAEDAAKEREAIERKATSDILQAQQDRDVVAAERAKKQKDADLRGVDEEALAKQAENSQKLDELRNQFTAERQERQAAFQLQIQQIQTEAQERVRAAQQSGQQTLSQVAVLEKQLADLRAQFAKENTELQAQFEQEAQVKRLQALQGRAQELQAQIKLINGVLTGNLQVLAGNAAIALINGFSEQARRLLTGLLGSVNAPRVREQAAIPNRRAITAYAEGGVTPTGLFAANREEIFSTDTRLAVLNRDTSKALLAGLQAGQRGAGASVIVNLGGIHNPNLGGVATPADVQAMGEGVLGVVVEGLKQHQLLVQKGSVA